jgi:lipopolysaccharide heptosyltransferase II
MDKLEIPRDKNKHYPLELAIDRATYQKALKIWENNGLTGQKDIVGINPVSRGNTKCWPLASFAELAGLLYRAGYKPVFFGSLNDIEPINKITAMLDFKTVNLAGKTTLLEAAALISRCAAFVSNDSALMHFAAALDIPVVGIFGPSDPLHTHPWSINYRVVAAPKACLKQKICKEKVCATLECLQKITAVEVFRAVQKLLK